MVSIFEGDLNNLTDIFAKSKNSLHGGIHERSFSNNHPGRDELWYDIQWKSAGVSLRSGALSNIAEDT